MVTTQFTKAVRQLRGVLARQYAASLADADLWTRYVHDRDEAAFEALVRRHGPMVIGVCRRILRNEQDAEDAFQATFLVLVRRASSLQSPSTLAGWLRGVAYRTAPGSAQPQLQDAPGTGKDRPVPCPALLARGSMEPSSWPVLDQELSRLAEKYRAAVVLCDLEGKRRSNEAHRNSAGRLGRWPAVWLRGKGTVWQSVWHVAVSALPPWRGRWPLANRSRRLGACVPSHLVLKAVKAAACPQRPSLEPRLSP